MWMVVESELFTFGLENESSSGVCILVVAVMDIGFWWFRHGWTGRELLIKEEGKWKLYVSVDRYIY